MDDCSYPLVYLVRPDGSHLHRANDKDAEALEAWLRQKADKVELLGRPERPDQPAPMLPLPHFESNPTIA